MYIGQNEWTHVNCALWSAEVFEDDDGALKNVHMAVLRGKKLVSPPQSSFSVPPPAAFVQVGRNLTASRAPCAALREVSEAGSDRRLLPHLVHDELPLHVRAPVPLQLPGGQEGLLPKAQGAHQGRGKHTVGCGVIFKWMKT